MSLPPPFAFSSFALFLFFTFFFSFQSHFKLQNSPYTRKKIYLQVGVFLYLFFPLERKKIENELDEEPI